MGLSSLSAEGPEGHFSSNTNPAMAMVFNTSIKLELVLLHRRSDSGMKFLNHDLDDESIPFMYLLNSQES
jgi:hypothetical protein